MIILKQSMTDTDFVQDPYKFYREVLEQTDSFFWQNYDKPAFFDHNTVSALLKDKRLGREIPKEQKKPVSNALKPFYEIEGNSMLELEPPKHKRLRSLVLKAFTSNRISKLSEEIKTLCNKLIDEFPDGNFDILANYTKRVPVIVIARLLGVPDSMENQLLNWSNDMVKMYQAEKSKKIQRLAITSTKNFTQFMRSYVEERRAKPSNDLISHLISVEEEGKRLNTEELISNCILLLNAGHEATVHTLGNGIKILLENKPDYICLDDENLDATIEEILRFDPPLHIFNRYAYQAMDIGEHQLHRGSQIALILGATGRDPSVWNKPNCFDPFRKIKTNTAFGAGIHFCLGAPLARMELKIAISELFRRCPNLRLKGIPKYANIYHFRGLEKLIVSKN